MVFYARDQYEEYKGQCYECGNDFWYYWPTLDMFHNFDRLFICKDCSQLFCICLYDIKELYDSIYYKIDNDDNRAEEIEKYLPKCNCSGYLSYYTRRCPVCHESENIHLEFIKKIERSIIRIESKDIDLSSMNRTQ